MTPVRLAGLRGFGVLARQTRANAAAKGYDGNVMPSREDIHG